MPCVGWNIGGRRQGKGACAPVQIFTHGEDEGLFQLVIAGQQNQVFIIWAHAKRHFDAVQITFLLTPGAGSEVRHGRCSNRGRYCRYSAGFQERTVPSAKVDSNHRPRL